MTRKQLSTRSQQHQQRMRARINNSRGSGKKVKSVVPKKVADSKGKGKHASSIIESLIKVSSRESRIDLEEEQYSLWSNAVAGRAGG